MKSGDVVVCAEKEWLSQSCVNLVKYGKNDWRLVESTVHITTSFVKTYDTIRDNVYIFETL